MKTQTNHPLHTHSTPKTKAELEAYCRHLEQELESVRKQNKDPRPNTTDFSPKELETLYRLSENLCCTTDMHGNFRRFNAAWTKCLGYTSTELQGARFLDFVHPDDYTHTAAYLTRLNEGDSAAHFKNRYRKCDGSYVWQEWSLAVSDGMIYALAHDITEQYNTEQQLRAGETRYRSLIEAMSEGILVQNARGEIVESNRAAEQILGLTAAQMVGQVSGQPDWHTIRADGSPFPADAHPAMFSLQTGMPVRNIIMGVNRADADKVRWLNVSAAPIFNHDQNKPDAVVTTFTDVTAYRYTDYWLRLQRDLAITLSGPLEPHQALQEILHTAFQIDGIDSGGIYTIDAQTGEIVLTVHENLPDWFIQSAARYPADSPNAQIVRAGKAIYLPAGVSSVGKPQERVQAGLRGVAIIPVMYQEQAIAVLNLASHTFDEIPPEARTAVETLAAQIGPVLARVSAEQAMQEARDNLQILFDTLDDFLFILDEQGNILHVNPVVLRRLGYTRQELIGKHVLFVHPPERGDEAMRIILDMLAGLTDVCPVPLRARDGTLIPVETKVSPGRWSNRNVLFGISRDVTERQRALADLEAQREKYAHLMHISGDAIHVIDQNGKLREWNQAFLEHLGYSENEAAELQIADWDARWEPKELSAIVSSGKPLTERFETLHRRRDGFFAFVEITAVPITINGEKMIYASARDITERKRIEAALRESEERYRHLFTDHAASMWLVDPVRGEIVEANPAASRFYGYPIEQLRGMKLSEINPMSETAISEHMLNIRNTTQNHLVVTHRLASGELRQVEIYSSPVLLSGRELLYSILHDVTEREHARERIQQLVREQETILTASPVGMSYVRDRKIQWCNQAQYTMFGYENEDALGHDIEPLYAEPGEYERVGSEAYPVMARGETYATELHFRRRDNTLFWAHVTGRAINPASPMDGSIWIMQDITARKSLERELQEQRDFLTQIVNTMGQGLTVTDETGHFEFVNNAYAQLCGLTAQEITGKAPEQVTLLQDQAVLEAAWQARQRGEITHYENRLERPDGHAVPVLITGAPRWRDGRVAGTIAVITDLSPIKRAEQALRDSEELFRQFVEQSSDGICLLDEEGRVIVWNRAMEFMTGYPRTRILSLPYLEIQKKLAPPERLNNEDLSYQAHLTLQALQTGKAPFLNNIIEAPFMKSSGEMRFAQQVIFSIPTQSGHRLGIVARDVTAQHEAHDQLAAERALLQTVIDTIPDQVFAINLEGHYVINNRAAGLSEAQFGEAPYPKTTLSIYSAEMANAFRTDDQRVMITGQEIHREEPTIDAHGDPRWVMIQKVPWRNSEGHIIGLVGVASDITARRRMEQEVRDLNSQLLSQIEQLQYLQAELREQSIRDPLTQLYNRRYLNETITREIARAQRHKYQLGIMMLDLDHFKTVNDTYGHTSGDETLQTISRLIVSRLRASDVVCRYGGEEILCLLPETNEQSLQARAEDLRNTIRHTEILPQHPQVHITISVGLSLLPPDGSNIDEAIKAADRALYLAKAAGRNCIRFVSPAFTDSNSSPEN